MNTTSISQLVNVTSASFTTTSLQSIATSSLQSLNTTSVSTSQFTNTSLVSPVANTTGPIQLSTPSSVANQTVPFQAALTQLNAINSSSTNSSSIAYTIDPATGERSDARTGYLDPILNRPNLWVMTGQVATQLIMQGGANGSVVSNSTQKQSRLLRTRQTTLQSIQVVGVQVREIEMATTETLIKDRSCPPPSVWPPTSQLQERSSLPQVQWALRSCCCFLALALRHN